MIDLGKIHRFEKTLQYYNRSRVVANFWNEIITDFENIENYISHLEWERDQAAIHHRNFIEKQIIIHKQIAGARRFLSIVKSLNHANQSSRSD